MDYSSNLLKGQVALVTGASAGIGKAVAQHLALAGAAVAVNYHSHPEEGDAVVEAIRAQGGTAIAIQADVSQEEDVQQLFAATLEAFGRLDILVSNAGLQADAPFTQMTLADWNKAISVNLTGQFLCAREAARQFLKQGPQPEISRATGKIICMSSVHQVIPWAGHVNYAASKGGIHMLMQSMAQELAPQQIRINAIAPGAIKTDINRSVWEDPEAAADLKKLIPSNRIGDPADVAKAAVWLASDDSDYVNGTTLYVDGGMTLYPGFATGG